MAKQINYTKYTLDWARSIEGWKIGKVEYWQPNALALEAATQACRRNLIAANNALSKLARSRNPGVRVDLFGFIDIIALTGSDIVAIQSTSFTAKSQHMTKIKTECLEAVQAWCKSGGRVELWAWRKHEQSKQIKNAEGKTVRRQWLPDITEITVDERDLAKPF